MKCLLSFVYRTLLIATHATQFALGVNGQIQVGLDIDGETAASKSGWVVSMPDANTLAIGAPGNQGNGFNAGHARVFTKSGGVWLQKGSDIDGEADGDESGWTVSMPVSNTLAVGAPYNDGQGKDAGHVRVYTWNGAAWVQKGSDLNGEGRLDNSGWAISMADANTVAIGAPNNNGNGFGSGHVRVYTWNGSAWLQMGNDIDGEAEGDNFGCSVSMPDPYTVAIGARGNDGKGSEAGHVRVFTFNGTAWVQKGADIDGASPQCESGASVSMPDANTLAVGSNNKPAAFFGNHGYVQIYAWKDSTWVQKGSGIAGGAVDDRFGYSISMPDANHVAIGAPNNDVKSADAGLVRVFTWKDNAWTKIGEDIVGESTGDWTGFSICMADAHTLAIGAPFNKGNGSQSGHVRVFAFQNQVGFRENVFGQDLKWYPNPTRGDLNLELGSINDRARITIYNALGQIVFSEAYEKASALQIQIPGPAGVYSVEVSSEGKQAMLRVNKW